MRQCDSLCKNKHRLVEARHGAGRRPRSITCHMVTALAGSAAGPRRPGEVMTMVHKSYSHSRARAVRQIGILSPSLIPIEAARVCRGTHGGERRARAGGARRARSRRRRAHARLSEHAFRASAGPRPSRSLCWTSPPCWRSTAGRRTADATCGPELLWATPCCTSARQGA